MIWLIAATGSLALLASTASQLGDAAAQDRKSQVVTRAGSQPSTKGPAEYFTGNVRVDPLFAA
ncbi:MAG TPA: cupin domain-containing protein, partial [Thermoanaerobaculia bacterium]|nr:cupin domain-containing protein [Thermoanaerobaculia bacterium]